MDKSVRRAYSDGVEEWRRKLADGRVEWQNNRRESGIDELLGDGVVKRTKANGTILYGREQGYGRTAWSDGQLTVNGASTSGRMGELLTVLGLGLMVSQIIDPPLMMSWEEEEAIRQKAAQQTNTTGGGGDGGSSSTSTSDDYDRDDPTDNDSLWAGNDGNDGADGDSDGGFGGGDSGDSGGDFGDGGGDFG